MRHSHPDIVDHLSHCPRHLHRLQHSFPTRRSSDLGTGGATPVTAFRIGTGAGLDGMTAPLPPAAQTIPQPFQDRKSTRLNSSHITRSYAVFCLKKITVGTWFSLGHSTIVVGVIVAL